LNNNNNNREALLAFICVNVSPAGIGSVEKGDWAPVRKTEIEILYFKFSSAVFYFLDMVFHQCGREKDVRKMF
jgi:hypothetical protein